ncbi:MAG: glycosyltransferase [Vicinamibacterales bacterium]
MRIIVVEARAPFTRETGSLRTLALMDACRGLGHQVDQVRLPLDERPHTLLEQASRWALLNLAASNGRRVDAVIATNFPSYVVRHPHKVVWPLRQPRVAYDSSSIALGDLGPGVEADTRLRQRLVAADTAALNSCAAVFTDSVGATTRLRATNGIESTPLSCPPPPADPRSDGPIGRDVVILSPLAPSSRVDLAIRAMVAVPQPVRLVVVGDGPARQSLEGLSHELMLGARVEFGGRPDGPAVARLVGDALCVLDLMPGQEEAEATLAGLRAGRPVITTADSGAPRDHVEHGRNGLVCEATPEGIGVAVAQLAGPGDLARSLGRAALKTVPPVSWTELVGHLLAGVPDHG